MREMMKLRVLIELDNGEFHAMQCARSDGSRKTHKEMSEAFDWLQDNEFIELVGDEFFVTELGKDALLSVEQHLYDSEILKDPKEGKRI